MHTRGFTIPQFLRIGLTHKKSQVESPTVATCPFAGERGVTRGMRVLRKEYARSRPQRLFEENVGKAGMCGLQTIIMKGSGVVFTHGEGISTPHVRHKGRQPLIKCANMTSICVIFPFLRSYVFLCFLSFCGRQGRFPLLLRIPQL